MRGYHAHKWCWGRSRPVHPRMCGAIIKEFIAENRLAGSSPLPRGHLSTDSHCRPKPRFIPAYAGLFFPSCCSVDAMVRLIPARAGLFIQNHIQIDPANGSSPHVRGYRTWMWSITTSTPVYPRIRGVIVFVIGYGPAFLRFIPACAGLSSVVV